MQNLLNFINSFHKRSGTSIFLGSVFAKIISFATSLVIVKILPNKELGIVLFAYNICTFVFPIAGFGLFQSLLIFAPSLASKQHKDQLYNYVQKKGFLLNLLIILVGVIATFFIDFKITEAKKYVIAFLFIIIPSFYYENIRIYFKVFKNNKLFAYTEFVYNSILFVLAIGLSYLFEEAGYAIALIATPILTSIIFLPKSKIELKKTNKPQIVDKAFWSFGITASFTSISSQLLVVIDILLVGFILAVPQDVTAYKYISLLPLSILFLPQVFMNADFVSLTENIYNKKKVYQYIKNYVIFFSFISLVVLAFIYLFGREILAFIDSDFAQHTDSLFILTIGIVPVLMFRGLFGNILSSIKKVHANMLIVLIGIVLNCIGNYYLIPQLGIKGAATTSAIVMWFTSISSTIAFVVLYKRFLSEKTA